MGFIGGALGYHLLRSLTRGGTPDHCDGSAFAGRSKLEVLLGMPVAREVQDRVVIDYGCGAGVEAIEMAQRGARRVIGIDIRESALSEARAVAERAGVADRCEFTTATEERADLMISLDAFEHFADPAGILAEMHRLLRPDGSLRIAFGPTWYHPFGAHLMSVFPWAHLVFTEGALMRWRADIRSDGARRFCEVEGGLNQMTIGRFEKLLAASPFRVVDFELVPIRKLRPLANPVTREFTTSIVRCRLAPRAAEAPRLVGAAYRERGGLAAPAGAHGARSQPAGQDRV